MFIKNTGTEKHKFWVSAQVIHQPTGKVTSESQWIEDETVRQGEEDEVRIVITMPADSRKGIYDIEVFLWKEMRSGIGEGLIESNIINNAFEVI